MIEVINGVRLNTDEGKTSVLVLLDLSAAFDIVDYSCYFDLNTGLGSLELLSIG